MPRRNYAKQSGPRSPAQMEQEANLAYVCITRAREELYIAGKLGFETEPTAIEQIERCEVV